MKFYYCSGIITFTDNSEKEPYKGNEPFEFIIQNTNKKKAKIRALEKARNNFDKEINDGYDEVKVVMDEFYQTDGLAMI